MANFKNQVRGAECKMRGTIGHASVRFCRKVAQSLGIFPDSTHPDRQKILNGEWRILKQEAQRDEPKTEADYPAALQGSWESDNPRRAVQGMRFLH
jgi:1-acyl-sn-glycerol-3-phosphate acyltransferase